MAETLDYVGVLTIEFFVMPGGVLIASGIIAEREDEVAIAFAAAGLIPVERKQETDWVALVYRKQG